MSESVSPENTMVDWVDSLYQHVKKRIRAKNPSRAFAGIVMARSWPMKEYTPGALYLLLSDISPAGMGGGLSSNPWSAPAYSEKFAWAWSIVGNDVGANEQAANRSVRYTQNYQIMQEILYGMYPGNCDKKSWSLQPDNSVVGTSYVPSEWVIWTKPRFSTKQNKDSGIIFGTASSIMTSLSPTISD